MTNSATLAAARNATTWNGTTFAVIAARPYPSVYRPTYRTEGHSTPTCPSIQGKTVATDGTLNDYLAANEWFDGEVEYLDVWPCGTCVSVTGGQAATIEFEAPRPSFGTGTGTARPAVEADPREEEARTYAAAYTGTFKFMVDMKAKAQRPAARLTPNMVTAILKCKAADERRAAAPATVAPSAPQTDEDARRATLRPNAYAGVCRACKAPVAANVGRREQVAGRWTVLHSTTAECATATPAPAAEATPATVTPDVAAGHYAVETDEGHLAFYNVDRPTEGRWAGRTFLSVQASDEYHPIRGRAAADAILAKIAVDPIAAMLRYGQEIGRCGHCNRTLTDETSRALGIGPVCRAGLGMDSPHTLSGSARRALGL